MGLNKFEDLVKRHFLGIGLSFGPSSGHAAPSRVLSARQTAAVKAAEQKLREKRADGADWRGRAVPEMKELWWSGKMGDAMERHFERNAAMRGKRNWALLADGRAVQYMCCTEAGQEHGMAWNDVVHIGTGFALGCYASLREVEWEIERLKESSGYAMMENLWLASQCAESLDGQLAEPKRKAGI